MLNTFIPRPSYSKWKQAKESMLQPRPILDESSSDESDYYGTESEASVKNKVVNKPNLKIGRLSTVKEQIIIESDFISELKRINSGGPSMSSEYHINITNMF
jgi:hypothetical protein